MHYTCSLSDKGNVCMCVYTMSCTSQLEPFSQGIFHCRSTYVCMELVIAQVGVYTHIST